MTKHILAAAGVLAFCAGAAEARVLQTETRVLNTFAGSIGDEKPAPIFNGSKATPTEFEGRKCWEINMQAWSYPGIHFNYSDAPQDWSGYGGIAVDIVNTGRDPLRIALRIDNPGADGHNFCWGGDAMIEAGRGGTYFMTFGKSPRTLGMKALPGYDGLNNFASGGEPRFTFANVTGLIIYLVRPTREHTFLLGGVRLMPGREENYEGIIDGFGQFTRAEWPGKVKNIADMKKDLELELKEIAVAPTLPGRSKFGGWADGPKLEATGFFRTEKYNGKWALVDPEGHLFLSVGPCGLAFGSGTVFTGREYMFATNPKEDEIVKKHFRTKFPWEGWDGESVDYYAANLERKFGDDYRAKAFDLAQKRMLAWGCNTVAAFSDWGFYSNAKIPYTINLWAYSSKSLGSMPDAFDPDFENAVRYQASRIPEASRNDPWCIGYWVGNEDNWWGVSAMNYDANSSYGKRAMLAQLGEKYGNDIAKLNAAWKTNFASWDDLRAPFNPSHEQSQAMAADRSAFLSLYAAQHYRIVRDELKKVAPNHMYIGSRYGGAPDEVLAQAVIYQDTLSFNIYASTPEGDYLKKHDKPIILGEFHFGATDRGMFPGNLMTVPTQADRALGYANYMRVALDNPNIVGAHWYQYTDQSLIGREQDGENGNIGFVSITDSPYNELLKTVKAVHKGMYEHRFGK